MKYFFVSAILLLVFGCGIGGGTVAGVSDVRIIPIDYALTQKLAAESVLKTQTPVALTKIKPSKSPEYRLGAGDKVFISIYSTAKNSGSESEELTRVYPVRGDYGGATEIDAQEVTQSGFITLPYIDDVKLKDKTVSEVQKEIYKKTKKFFKNPQVEVKVTEYNSRRVVVTGEVAKPGEQKIQAKELTILNALEAAGGVTADGDLQNATLTDANGAVEKLDLLALLTKGDVSQNRTLQTNDVLYIPTNHRNKVFVMGEVVKPAAQSIPKGRLTLTEVLNDATGLDKITASKSKVYVIRGVLHEKDLEPKGKMLPAPDVALASIAVYQLDVNNPAAFVVGDQFMLQPRDVVYVSEREIAEWSRFVNQIIPSSIQSLLYGALYVN